MNTTNAVISRIKEEHKVSSDYAVSKLLGVTRTSLSDYRHNRRQFSDEIAFRAAKLIKTDPVELVANLHRERAANDVDTRVWNQIEKQGAIIKRMNQKDFQDAMNALLAGTATDKQRNLVREIQNNVYYVKLQKFTKHALLGGSTKYQKNTAKTPCFTLFKNNSKITQNIV